MKQTVIFVFSGLLLGILFGYVINLKTPLLSILEKTVLSAQNKQTVTKKQVVGFLPYWLLDKAKPDYSKSITTLTYFGLPIDSDGTIQKRSNPQELQPGWNTFISGKVDPFFVQAKRNNIRLSLLLDTGNTEVINALITDPISHAKNLVTDIKPLLSQYGFSDLNLDIEYTSAASSEARLNFTKFLQEIKKDLGPHLSLTLEISPVDAIKKQLIDVTAIGKIADNIILMAYDFHAPDSYVTGPVAPLNGYGTTSEYDVATALEQTLQNVPSGKIILGVPLYGYEWETIGSVPRSAIIAGTGVLASSSRAEELLKNCATCSATFDNDTQEEFVTYLDQYTNTYHQLSFPDKNAMRAKIKLANDNNIGGVALWALGYEGSTILDPLAGYKK